MGMGYGHKVNSRVRTATAQTRIEIAHTAFALCAIMLIGRCTVHLFAQVHLCFSGHASTGTVGPPIFTPVAPHSVLLSRNQL